MSGVVASYASFGITLKNERWSWSGRSADRVVLTLWQDEINYKNNPPSCSNFGVPRLDDWTRLPGNRERIQNLVWAREHCDGLFSVVIARAKDLTASPRHIHEAFPTKIVMRLLDLNEETGEFSAEIANA